VLRAVQESASPVSAAELAQDLGLHHNTVREHLESLVKQGMVSMTPVSTGRRGRPTLRYQAAAALLRLSPRWLVRRVAGHASSATRY